MDLEPARSRAGFYAPEIAFDRPVPKVPAAIFSAAREQAFHPDTLTGFVTLDQSTVLSSSYPATTPTILARYIVLNRGDSFAHHLASTGEVYYVLRGAGRTCCVGEQFSWAEGDAFCLPGATKVEHVSECGAKLMLVTNEPELAYLRAVPAESATVSILPTLFPSDLIESHVREVHNRAGEQRSAGKSVIFVTHLMEKRRVTTPTLLSSINTLEPGGNQRPHKHSSAALTLCITGEGVHSLVDGQRIDWQPDVLMVTPPGAIHSHHNEGAKMMRSFVVQDTGLHTELRTTNFSWTS
jgi:gentisate 1,2-dioxygenase